MSNTVLSVDWDYFFPIPQNGPEILYYDWGHAESPFFIQPDLWYYRAARFALADKPLPMPNDAWKTFWDRFWFHEDATLFVHESHSGMVETGIRSTISSMSRIINFDAHHDAYCNRDHFDQLLEGFFVVTCEDWAAFYRWQGVRTIIQLYPQWKTGWKDEHATCDWDIDATMDDGTSWDRDIRTAFLCRSGAWVPPWCDGQFDEFVALFPRNVVIEKPVTRQWSDSKLDDVVSQYRSMQRCVAHSNNSRS